jgi:hypothetical protein
VSYDEVLITAGGVPFYVTFPNGGETLTGGCPLTVTWNVGGGSVASTVDILYSADGGSSFTPLAANTVNDGSEIVALPCTSTAQGRIEVRAVGNVFFDVSDADFGVGAGIAPVASASAIGGSVDASCQRTVTYSGSIVDDCGVDASSVSVTVSLPTANATLGVPSTNKLQSDGRTVTVTGSVVVSNLLGSPAVVRVRIDASDRCGNPVSHTVDASVVDTTPPELDVVLDRDVLWPPNHLMSGIVATITATDPCESNPTVVLTSITSDEPDDAKGDGHFPDDIQEATYGSLDTQFLLRAERQGTGSGRTYTIVYTASDMSGNIGRDTVCVRVPHDLAGNGIEPARPLGAQGEDRTETAAGKPVVPETSSVTQGTPVVVDIYSALGRRVGSVELDAIPASGAALHWDGTDGTGKRLPSGVYFYRVRGREGTRTHKLVLIH